MADKNDLVKNNDTLYYISLKFKITWDGIDGFWYFINYQIPCTLVSKNCNEKYLCGVFHVHKNRK